VHDPSSTDTDVRPETGIARGRWEAPPWAFALTIAATILGGIAWLAIALRTRRSGR
jgi:hypothetical protein